MKKAMMSRTQRFITTILPRRAESIEAESRNWKATCQCGNTKSIWEMGGVRWKGAGEPRRKVFCTECQKVAWHRIHYQKDPEKLT